MSRLIFVPQFPAKMRYQEWWYHNFPNRLKKYFDDVIVLGRRFVKQLISSETGSYNREMFSHIDYSIKMEISQIEDFLNLQKQPNDILLFTDISFPGFFANVLYHERFKNAFAFCHATSLNILDYFEPVRDSKWLVESGHSKLFKKVFVASDYHKDKLGWDNVINLRALPNIPARLFTYSEKIYDVISVSRPTPQKVTKELEDLITFPTIRKEHKTWEEYFNFISSSKCCLITSKEECYGYQVIDIVNFGCIPIAPMKFSYPELLDSIYLYRDEKEMIEKVNKAVSGELEIPKLKNQTFINTFYDNLAKIMLKFSE